MNIEKKLMKFDDGTEKEMVIVDKGGYDLVEIKEHDVGRIFPKAKKPSYYTVEQWEEIKKAQKEI